MKRIIIFLGMLAVFVPHVIMAQNAARDRLDAYKIAFFTKRLNLTPQEAERFWPVYNVYQAGRNKIQLERQEINRNFNQNELNMSDRELAEAAELLIDLEIREAALAKEFHDKIKTILPPVKILRLYQAENMYRAQLLNELRERNQVRNNPNRLQQ